ncbi:glycosyltransferase [Pseudoalteromonas sp. SG43-7]|uniref:glycosyltransferase family 4 protein n=1 Tax=Pseudoalteromonas sp. SG43-7 TaxID=2760966 RepID=UPI0015FFEE30|nr:glycosyltransferase [Pseudoalteromonas sp. SG43-7]MBB1424661.1 glycosyltransferase [Pseudoalteromonas sp. SG43-7]
MSGKVYHIITGLNDGGAEAVLYRLCSSDKVHEHTVISLMDEGKYGHLLRGADIKVYCLNMPPGRVTLSGLIKLYQLIRKGNPYIIQTWMYHADMIGGVIARLAGVRNVFWGVHHTNLVKGESKNATIVVAKLNAILSKFIPHKIIYCAESARQVHESKGYKSAIGVVIPNGYNLNDFTPSIHSRLSFRKENNIDKDTFLIGHVGRFHPLKDYENLMGAIGILKNKVTNFKFMMVGTELDYCNEQLSSYILNNDCQGKVSLLGRRNDIPVVMNGFDLFILSSISEAFPNVLSEAMACGTPCVTTDVGDAAYIVGATGWIVPIKEPQDLSMAIFNAINEHTSQQDEFSNRKLACRERIEKNFSIESMILKYHSVWLSPAK